VITFISVFPPYRGGIARFSDYLISHLRNHFPVEAVNFKTLYPEFLFPGTTQFESGFDHNSIIQGLHSYNPISWINTGKEIAASKPETLLITYWHPFFIPAFNQIIRIVKKRSPETKIIVLAHNIKPHESFIFTDSLAQNFFEKADHIITLSDQTLLETQDLGITTRVTKLFHPIYESDDPAQSKPLFDIDEDEFGVLFFGLIRDYKGLDVMIKALNRLDIEALKLRPIIVGEFYTAKEPYLEMIKEEHKERYIIVDRFVENEEIPFVFNHADALVLPYKTASQSGVFADAVNYNVPVIVSNHPGLTEHVKSPETGLIFENMDDLQLAESIKLISSDVAMRSKLHSNIKELQRKLSWENFSLEVEKIIHH
jgi:glycosyltransferase involved in cell wall biosynthesis